MSYEEFEKEVGITMCPDDYGYEEWFDIDKQIIELELDAIDGNIPTWYAYQEIDRLKSIEK